MAKIHQSVEIAPEARAMFLKRYRSTWNIGLEITSKIVARFSKETRSKGLVCVGRCGGGVGKGGGVCRRGTYSINPLPWEQRAEKWWMLCQRRQQSFQRASSLIDLS